MFLDDLAPPESNRSPYLLVSNPLSIFIAYEFVDWFRHSHVLKTLKPSGRRARVLDVRTDHVFVVHNP